MTIQLSAPPSPSSVQTALSSSSLIISDEDINEIGALPLPIDSSDDELSAEEDEARMPMNRLDDSHVLKVVPRMIPYQPPASAALPWYRAGGMEVNLNGMAINTGVTLAVLIRNAMTTISSAATNDWSSNHPYLALGTAIWLWSATVATVLTGRTLYCSLVLPTFMLSIGLVATLPSPLLVLVATLILAITKVNICMSVCLHRYAAHQAFACGPVTRFVILALGCLANQGGPIWWSSQHRCHHKFCDLPRDPHSPTQVGTEQAFAFFGFHKLVHEEFVPRHLNRSIVLRFLDTWAWLMVAVELYVAYSIAGCTGLFCAYTSGWLSQAITLWFNVANHPVMDHEHDHDKHDHSHAKTIKRKDLCTATNDTSPMMNDTFYLPFFILNALSNSFLYIVMEGEHDHHHTHATLAKRSPTDLAYWTFIKPLEMLGLVWNVVKEE